MRHSEDNDLERFIHEKLQALPERAAPEGFTAGVLREIERRASRPWWFQPFTAWPGLAQAALFAVLLSLLAGVAYIMAGPAEQVSASSLQERLLAFGWVKEVLRVTVTAVAGLFAGKALYWWLAAGVVVCMMYGMCVAGAVALYRITTRHSMRHI